MNMSYLIIHNASHMNVEFVLKSHSSGFILLSFVVCFIGSWTTLELAHRRTAMNGWHNWYVDDLTD